MFEIHFGLFQKSMFALNSNDCNGFYQQDSRCFFLDIHVSEALIDVMVEIEICASECRVYFSSGRIILFSKGTTLTYFFCSS